MALATLWSQRVRGALRSVSSVLGFDKTRRVSLLYTQREHLSSRWNEFRILFRIIRPWE